MKYASEKSIKFVTSPIAMIYGQIFDIKSSQLINISLVENDTNAKNVQRFVVGIIWI